MFTAVRSSSVESDSCFLGDVQPFVALGKTLKEAHGHRVRLATHATFKNFVEENGLEFFNIGGDPGMRPEPICPLRLYD